jgi:signal transduction histidine kinase/ActR/RegA family two-component response regulator
MIFAKGVIAPATRDDRGQTLLLAGLTIAYIGAFLFSDQLTRDANGMPALWPVNAILAAGLLHLTPARRAILLLAALATRLISHRLAGDPWALVAIYTVCDMTETIAVAVITYRVTRGRARIRNVAQALTLLAAVLPVTMLMAAIGSGLSAVLMSKPFWPLFVDWVFCTALGMAIALPATLVLLDPVRPSATQRRPPLVQLGLYALVAALTAVAYNLTIPMPFMVFPAAMLAAFMLGPKGAAWSAAIVIAVAAPYTVSGLGQRVINPDWSQSDRIRVVQVFVTALFFTSLAASLFLYKEDRLKQLMARRTAIAREARAKAMAASQAKTEFLATMSHEIRTPLNGILGFANLLGATETLSSAGRRKLDLIAQAGRSLVTIVDDVLDFSKIEAGQIPLEIAPASPAALLRDAAAIIAPEAEAKGLILTVEGADDGGALYDLDESRLRQVLLNLLNNAVKFTPSGEITARLAVAACETGSQLLVEICDTGIGIAAEQQDRLFQRFSQADGSIRRSFGGTGLGLAICKALVSRMDGEIGLQSVVGLGSTFWIRLPIQRSQTPQVADGDSHEGPTARILLVDDHPMNRELGKAMLMLAGCEVETADDGDEAVRIAAQGGFDLILMDIHMPRMDGVAACEAIRALMSPAGAVPIIALSADVMPQQIERCRRAGMVDHVAKPIDREALYAVINRWLAPDPIAA